MKPISDWGECHDPAKIYYHRTGDRVNEAPEVLDQMSCRNHTTDGKYPCPSCALKDARIALLEKVVEAAREYVDSRELIHSVAVDSSKYSILRAALRALPPSLGPEGG
jgi:hypothetical protein